MMPCFQGLRGCAAAGPAAAARAAPAARSGSRRDVLLMGSSLVVGPPKTTWQSSCQRSVRACTLRGHLTRTGATIAKAPWHTGAHPDRIEPGCTLDLLILRMSLSENRFPLF